MKQESSKNILKLLILSLMKKGKKQVAEQQVFELVVLLREKYTGSSSTLILKAVHNIKPLIGFRNVRLRGLSYKVPFFLKEELQIKTALDWLVSLAAKSKSNLSNSLAKELIQASLKQGDLIKKRNDIHQLGNQNKVFAHYRWF